MKRIVAFVLAVAVAALTLPVPLAAAVAGQTTGTISGIVTDANKLPLAGQKVQIRDLNTGNVLASATTSPQGQYTFSGLPAGNYAIEVLNANGRLVGISSTVSLTPTQMTIANVGVTVGPGMGAVGAAGGIAHFFAGTAGIISIAAASAGVGGILWQRGKGNASPSK